MTADLRELLERELRLHPRVAYQGLCAGADAARAIIEALPPLSPFRHDYAGAIGIVDWDHRLPSRQLALRVYAYYSDESFATGQESFDDRLEEIGLRDRYPEFDVPDFDRLVADEAYEIELGIDGTIGRCRLTSAWRRDIDDSDGERAIAIVRGSDEYAKVLEGSPDRPSHLGDLEAVSWTPPCESEHASWTLDVWYLLAFDGRVGTGRSFLVDLDDDHVVAVRDFSVRTG